MTRDGTETAESGRGPLRRDVLKAVGVGSAMAVLGGTASAQSETDDEGETGAESATDETEGGTVHVVRTLIRPPTNPERPADFFYEPTGLHVQPGDVVKYVFETPDHNVVSYHPAFGMQRRIPTEADAFSAPLLGWQPDSLPDGIQEPPEEMAGGAGPEATPEGQNQTDGDQSGPRPSTWLRGFETPGVYDVLCSPHEVFGMAMRIVVGDETDTNFETSNPEALPEPRAGPAGLARLTLTDPALDPENIVAQGAVSWSDLEAVSTAETGTPADEN